MENYKLASNPNNTRQISSYDYIPVDKSSLSEFKRDTGQSLANQIQEICELWESQNIDLLYEKLCFFSDCIHQVKIQYVPDTIPLVIEIIFIVINSYSSQDLDELKQNLLILCFKILVNISFHNELIPLFPPYMYEICILNFSKISTFSNEYKNNDIFTFCTDSILNILLNLTSCDDSCQEVKKNLTLDQIQFFYFNQDIEDSFKEICIKIFFNILKYSDVESKNFPVSQVLDFIKDIINTIRGNCINMIHIDWKIEWILNIIYLLVQNDLFAFKVMDDEVFQQFFDSCLRKIYLISYIRDEDKVYRIQILTLRIISMILNVEGYQFTFNVQEVVGLANDQRNENLILTALETLKNFADCPEHVDHLIHCGVLDSILERMEMGDMKMKEASIQVLANIFFYSPNINIDALVECGAVNKLTEKLFELDDIDTIFFSLQGFQDFFYKIAGNPKKYNLAIILNQSGLKECLPDLINRIDDQNVYEAAISLISFIDNYFANRNNHKELTD